MRRLDSITDSTGKFQGSSEGQGRLACCSPWRHKELDTTQRLNNNNKNITHMHLFPYLSISSSVRQQKIQLTLCSIYNAPENMLRHNIEQFHLNLITAKSYCYYFPYSTREAMNSVRLNTLLVFIQQVAELEYEPWQLVFSVHTLKTCDILKISIPIFQSFCQG